MALRRLNIERPAFVVDEDSPDGFRVGHMPLRPGVGGDKLGTSIYEIPEGEAICPYHYEYPEEEWLFVLAGTPSVRHPEGEERLDPGDVVCFVAGAQGAHQVFNQAAETARVMMVSTRTHPAVCVYPDSDKIATFTGVDDDSLNFRRADAVEYFDGERRP